MPLCQPTVVAGSKLQWVTIKQDTHLALQECKIVGKSWWSSGDVSWSYRVVIAATDTQIASAGDITQIVTDWELLQKLVSDEPPLDPESSPTASAETIERMLQRRWEAKQGKEKSDGESQQNIKDKGSEKDAATNTNGAAAASGSGSSASSTLSGEAKPSFEKRSSSRIFFRPGSTATSIKRLALGGSASESPFPGIPLHREGQPSPRPSPTCSPRGRSVTGSPTLSRGGSEGESTNKFTPETTALDQHDSRSGREREMRERYDRSLDALEKIVAPQHDDHYRVYVDCINSILYELRAVKNGQGKGSPADEVQTTAEVLCLLSRTSLDAARVLVAQQKAARERAGVAAVTVKVTAAPEEDGVNSRPVVTEEDQQKAKEGQGDAEPGSGDAEKVLAPPAAAAETPGEQAKEPTPTPQNSEGDDAKKRLQRCVELFAAANKSLASMTQASGGTCQE